jgi:hypothetical protein
VQRRNAARRVEKEKMMRVVRSDSLQRLLRRGLSVVGIALGSLALFSAAASADLAVLTPGHAYCYYFEHADWGWGGMHLVAANPTTISAGPSNYISGLNGKPQDTVFYVNCLSGGSRIGGVVYVGLPRIVMQANGSDYSFSRQYEIHGIRHLGTSSHTVMTVELAIDGTLSRDVINGTVKITAPGCLPHTYTVNYAGS